MKHRILLPCLLLLSACATSPLKLEGVNRNITPAMVDAAHPYLQARVVWGGMIVKTTPLQKNTQIEVLAFPLESNGEPDRQTESLGRFLVLHQGFLEPTDFASGRWISVVGTVGHSQKGKVGEADYLFPVVKSEQLQLWPLTSDSHTQTFFHFGVGIQF